MIYVLMVFIAIMIIGVLLSIWNGIVLDREITKLQKEVHSVASSLNGIRDHLYSHHGDDI